MIPPKSTLNIKNNSVTATLKSVLGILILSSSMVVMAHASPWPVAIVDAASAKSLETITIPVIANDIGVGLEITEVNTTTKGLGTVSISADKQSVSYRSASGFVGTDTFWYAFKDGRGRTNSTKVTVNVTKQQPKPPQWPTAGYESPEIKYNTPTVIAVLDNDQGVGLTIPELDTTTVKLGLVSVSEDGKKLLYTPPKGFSGNDEFWYVIKDAWGRTNAGKVTPVVLEQETSSPWPTSTPDYASTVSTRSVLIPVLKNDIGDGLALTEIDTTTVGLGTASIRNGSIRYTPLPGFSGQDSFWYDFEDKDGRANSAQVFVDVTANDKLSSIEFCGANYFTDGTLANTNISNNAVDPDAVQLDSNASVAEFTSPAGAFATVGNRTYRLETNDTQGTFLSVQVEDQIFILKKWSQDKIYGVGVRNDTLFFAVVPADQPDLPAGARANAKRIQLMAHQVGSELTTLGSYLATSSITLMANQQSTLVRFEGYENIGDGPDVVIPARGPADEKSYHYHEIVADNSKAVYLGEYDYAFQYRSTVGKYIQEKLFSYDQSLISSVKFTSSTGGNYTRRQSIRATNDQGTSSGVSAKLDKAVLSNDRLLLTTMSHSNATGFNQYGNSTDFPAKLYSFDSITSKFIELATCN